MADRKSCALARESLAKLVARMRPATGLEKTTSAIKAGFLGSVVTPLKAVGGNAISMAFRTLAEHPTRAAIDYVSAVAKSAVKGKLTLAPHEHRQVVLALDRDGLGVMGKGFWEGTAATREALRDAKKAFGVETGVRARTRAAVVTFVDRMNTRLNAEQVNRTLDYREIKYNHPVTDAVVNGVFGVMEAVDRPYWRASFDFSRYMQSKMLAAAEGLKDGALKQRAAELFANPTDEMTLRAVDDANYATFKNKNWLSRRAASLKQAAQQEAERKPRGEPGTYAFNRDRTTQLGAKAGSYLLETNLPFTGVPSAIAGQSLALASGPLSLVRLLGNRNPAAMSRIVSDATLGSALIATGYKLVLEGRLTGAAPRPGTPERAQWDAEGKQAWSVNVGSTEPGQAKWIDTRFAAPITAPLYAGAALAKVRRDDPEAEKLDQAVAVVGATAHMITQQTYLQNVGTLIDAIAEPEKKASRLLASQVPIPAILGQVARATDNERAPSSAVEQIKTRIPFLSRTVPPKVDALGRPEQRSIPERLTEVFSPGRLKEGTETAVTREFARLGIQLSLPSKTSRRGDVTVTRDNEEQAWFLSGVGAGKNGYLERYMATEAYRKMTDDQKRRALEAIQTRVHSQAHQSEVQGGR